MDEETLSEAAYNKLWMVFWIGFFATIIFLIASILVYNIAEVIYHCGGG